MPDGNEKLLDIIDPEGGFLSSNIKDVDRGPLLATAAGYVGLTSDDTLLILTSTRNKDCPKHGIRVHVPHRLLITQIAEQYPNACQLAYELMHVRNPWGQQFEFAHDLIIKAGGFDNMPIVTTLIAQDGEYPPSETNFRYGHFVAVVSSSLELGEINSPYDIPMTVVFGSEVWEKDLYEVPTRVHATLQHELTHYLSLFAAYQIRIGRINKERAKLSAKEMFSMAGWEGLADNLSSRVAYALKESAYFDNPLLYQYSTIKPILERTTNVRNLGNAHNVVNEILFGLLLRRWQGESLSRLEWNEEASQKAAQQFLLRIHSEEDLPKIDSKDGMLIKSVFTKDGFDYQQAVDEIRQLSQYDVWSITDSIAQQPAGGRVASAIYPDLLAEAPVWDPWGRDSFKE